MSYNKNKWVTLLGGVKLEKKWNQEREANATGQKLHWCRRVGWLDWGALKLIKCVCVRERER
jgi:hypothetical protein